MRYSNNTNNGCDNTLTSKAAWCSGRSLRSPPIGRSWSRTLRRSRRRQHAAVGDMYEADRYWRKQRQVRPGIQEAADHAVRRSRARACCSEQGKYQARSRPVNRTSSCCSLTVCRPMTTARTPRSRPDRPEMQPHRRRQVPGRPDGLHLYQGPPAGPTNQTVTTYTVGFGSGHRRASTASRARRRAAAARSSKRATRLRSARFDNIIEEILSVNTTFTAPTVAVNAFNRTQNLDDLYITVFGTPQPPSAGNTFHWPGNIKKYEINTDGTIVGRKRSRWSTRPRDSSTARRRVSGRMWSTAPT